MLSFDHVLLLLFSSVKFSRIFTVTVNNIFFRTPNGQELLAIYMPDL